MELLQNDDKVFFYKLVESFLVVEKFIMENIRASVVSSEYSPKNATNHIPINLHHIYSQNKTLFQEYLFSKPRTTPLDN